MTNDNFAVFILTHGRPDSVKTYQTLIKQNYTGPVYIVIDNEDSTAERYRELYGDKVVMFDKLAVSKTVDSADNFDGRKAIIYARNASFEIAEMLGYEYFLQLDDDYYEFRYTLDSKRRYRNRLVKNLDRLFEIVLDYYKSIPALTIALGQGGDIIGGQNSALVQSIGIKRKAMNTFFCSTKRPIRFSGRMNEDVSMYTSLGHQGQLVFSIFHVIISQYDTQSKPGGMSEVYKDGGTYTKSFYTIMHAPSCTKISIMGEQHKRLHHHVTWKNAVPKIISEDYRKASQNQEVA